MKSTKTIRLPLAIAFGALGLGAATTVAAQEMTNSIYGNFRYSYNYVDTENGGSTLRGENNASRLGFKGEVKGDKLTGFYHLEAGARNDGQGSDAFNSRFYYAGVKGGFGAVTVGRHSTAYKMAGLKVDPFYDVAHAGAGGGFSSAGATYGLSGLTNGWANNTLAYTSPAIAGGLKLNGAAYFDDGDEDNHDYAAGLSYGTGPILVGFQYYAVDDHTLPESEAPWAGKNSEQNAYRVHGSYAIGPVKLGASYEKLDPEAAGAEDQDYIYVSGTYAITPATRLAASFGDVSDDTPNSTLEGSGVNVGIFHDFFKNTTIYGLYSMADRDNAADVDVISVGLIYNFNMNLSL